MLRDTLITLLLNRAGNRSTDAVLRGMLETELLGVQEFYEGAAWIPAFLIKDDQTLTLTAGTDRLVPPTDFLREMDDESMRYGALYRQDLTQTDPWRVLVKDNYADLKALYPGSGPTRAYALVGNAFTVIPVPDIDYTYRLWYYGADATLTTNTENLWLLNAPDLFKAKLGEIMAKYYLHDAQMAAMFTADVQEAYTDVVNADVARMEAARMRQMGAD